MFHKNDIDFNRNYIGCVGADCNHKDSIDSASAAATFECFKLTMAPNTSNVIVIMTSLIWTIMAITQQSNNFRPLNRCCYHGWWCPWSVTIASLQRTFCVGAVMVVLFLAISRSEEWASESQANVLFLHRKALWGGCKTRPWNSCTINLIPHNFHFSYYLLGTTKLKLLHLFE